MFSKKDEDIPMLIFIVGKNRQSSVVVSRLSFPVQSEGGMNCKLCYEGLNIRIFA